MDGINLRLTVILCSFLLGGAISAQVESFEPALDEGSLLPGKDPILHSPLTGWELPSSPDIISMTATTSLPPSLTSRRTDSTTKKQDQEVSRYPIEGATSVGHEPGARWEERLKTLGSRGNGEEIFSHLPERRAHAAQAAMSILSSSSTAWEGSAMGWNGLSPVAPGQSVLQVPKLPGGSTALPQAISLKESQQLSSQRLMNSQDLGSIPREDVTNPSQPTSSKLSSLGKEKAVQTTKSKGQYLTTGPTGEGIGPLIPSQSRRTFGNTVSSRLESQNLSSLAGVVSTQPKSNRSSGPSGLSKGIAATVPTLPSKRFHGGTPGDAQRPDYTYQYQGTRRYSQGEKEYGTGNTYESLPYYRRKR